MGQILSSIYRLIWGETGDDKKRLIEHKLPIALPNLTLPNELITRGFPLPHTRLTSSLSSDVCIDLGSHGSMVSPFRVDSHGYCTSSGRSIYGKAVEDRERASKPNQLLCPESLALPSELLNSSENSDFCIDLSVHDSLPLHPYSLDSNGYSNTIRPQNTCGKAEDRHERPSVHKLLFSPKSLGSPSEISTASDATPQALLASPPSSESNSDFSRDGASIHPCNVDYFHGEVEDKKEGPMENSLVFSPKSLAFPSKLSTDVNTLLQPRLSPSLDSDSCSKSSTDSSMVRPSNVDFHCDSPTSGSMQQSILIFQQFLDSLNDSGKNCALPRHTEISGQTWDSQSHPSSGDPLEIVDASFETVGNWKANVSLDPPQFLDSSIEVLEDTRQVPSTLSEPNTVNTSGKRNRKRCKKLSKGVSTKERWIKHYSGSHNMLLVGDGDFSFSACLATAFGSANKMIATSLNSEDFLRANYGKAMSNIQNLKKRGCKVMHDVDATKMACHSYLKGMTFDRIIFNFPHAGFSRNESTLAELRRHRRLISHFLANAKMMLTEEGEIHISHKSNGFFRAWNLEILASHLGLRLVEETPFDLSDYPGYHTKYGFGGDRNFDCNPSKTYKFGLKKKKKKNITKQSL